MALAIGGARRYAHQRAMTDSTITRLAATGFAPPSPFAVPQRARQRIPRAGQLAQAGAEAEAESHVAPAPVPHHAPVPAPPAAAPVRHHRARAAITIDAPGAEQAQPAPAPTSTSTPKPQTPLSLRKRIAVLIAAIAVPAMAMPSDFGAEPGAAPTDAETIAGLTDTPSMPFERAGMSFPGSAFYYIDDSAEKALVALPNADPLDFGGEDGRELGSLIDAGPAAKSFFVAGSALSQARAQRCLAEAIWYEAGTESEAGQRAVAQVVLNRVAHRNYPGSVCGVVYEGAQRATGCQFSFTCDGSLARRPSGAAWTRAQDIAGEALAGKTYAAIGLATHYHTRFVDPYWASSLNHIGTIGAHRFYLMRGAAGEKGAFNGTYSGIEPAVSGRIPQAAPARSWAASGSSGPDYASAAPSASVRSPHPPRRAAVAERWSDPVSAPNRATSAPAAAATGSPPSDPAQGRSGQVRDQYSNAGAWKKRPGSAAAEPASGPPGAQD